MRVLCLTVGLCVHSLPYHTIPHVRRDVVLPHYLHHHSAPLTAPLHSTDASRIFRFATYIQMPWFDACTLCRGIVTAVDYFLIDGGDGGGGRGSAIAGEEEQEEEEDDGDDETKGLACTVTLKLDGILYNNDADAGEVVRIETVPSSSSSSSASSSSSLSPAATSADDGGGGGKRRVAGVVALTIAQRKKAANVRLRYYGDVPFIVRESTFCRALDHLEDGGGGGRKLSRVVYEVSSVGALRASTLRRARETRRTPCTPCTATYPHTHADTPAHQAHAR